MGESKAERFYDSQHMFERWRRSQDFEHSSCNYQLYDDGVMVEKWTSFEYDSNERHEYIVEIYRDGGGFSIYKNN